METKVFNVKGLGEWRVIQSNEDTRYAKVEGREFGGRVVSLWIPHAMIHTMTSRDELIKKNDSLRKSGDYFKAERNAIQKRNIDLSRKLDELERTNKLMKDHVEVLHEVQSEGAEEQYLRTRRHRVTLTIMTFALIVESVVMVMFCLNN